VHIIVLTHVSLSFISQLASMPNQNALHILYLLKVWGVRVMVFNATFNNISVISCRHVLLVEETGVPEKTIDLSQLTDKLFHIMLYRVHISGDSH
jgi:SpoU rRNA methylase family enzyme